MKGWAMNSEIFCGPVKWQRGRQPELPFWATKNRTIHGPPLHIAQVMFSACIKALLAHSTRNTDGFVVLCPTTALINDEFYILTTNLIY